MKISRFVQKQLVPHEKVRMMWRRHWFWLARRLIASAAILVAAALAMWQAEASFGTQMIVLAFPLTYATIQVISWWKRLLVLTDQRVMLLGGFFNFMNQPDDLPLASVHNVDQGNLGFVRSLFGEVEIKIQSGDAASGIFAKSFPTEAHREIREAQLSAGVVRLRQSHGDQGKDVLGRRY